MTTDFRALCAELVDIITAHANPDDYAVGYVAETLTRARAALADEPAAPEDTEPAAVTGQAGPTDDQLLATHDRATASFPPRHPDAEALNAVEYSVALELRKARAVLARWGNPMPAPPVDGEVAELVEWLRSTRTARLTRTAELLQRQALVPVSVSERLPGPEDCDAKGRCWLSTTETDPGWVLDFPERCTNWTHWLPAHALPLPEVGE